MDFVGKIEGESYEGEIEFNQGSFTMPFSAKRTEKAQSNSGMVADKSDAEEEKETMVAKELATDWKIWFPGHAGSVR